MSSAEIERRAKGIVLEQVGFLPGQFFDFDIMAERLEGKVLGYDSFDRTELCMALEEAFAIDVPEEDSEKFETVGDVVRYCVSKKRRPRERACRN